tara:strand:+ start:572 stop:772 length:201 start_codon:yes stop_codon:yes gene_type:complete
MVIEMKRVAGNRWEVWVEGSIGSYDGSIDEVGREIAKRFGCKIVLRPSFNGWSYYSGKPREYHLDG